MPVNKKNLPLITRLIGLEHTKLLVKLADNQDKMEHKWDRDTRTLGKQVSDSFIKQIEKGEEPSLDIKLFEQFVLYHYFHVVAVATGTAEQEINVIDSEKKMAKPKIPRSLAEVRKMYDRWRTTGRLPRGMKEQAKKIKDNYLKKVQKVWRRYSEDYREGASVDKQHIAEKIEEAAKVGTSRARTIIRTETTNYYNDVRGEIYDQVDGVWGYLFLAIRDQGTTKWCTNKTINGMRGRHGLVYEKNDPLTKRERPSCHWNCRSEMVPLTLYNPRHRKLIENKSLQRSNHKCYPLPEGWSS
jgi:SPP1 gp7 family putative phage head morphogenesis protein